MALLGVAVAMEDEGGFSINVPALKPVPVEDHAGRFQEVGVSLESAKEGVEARPPKPTGKCPHWAMLPATTNAPADRRNAGGFLRMAKDGNSQELVVLGGHAGDAVFGDVHTFNVKTGKAWAKATVSGAATLKRKNFAGAWMPKASGTSGDYVMFGGLTANAASKDGTVVAFKEDGAVVASALAAEGGKAPAARQLATLTVTDGGNTAVLYGGVATADGDQGDSKSDTWVLTRDGKAFSWEQVNDQAGSATPGPRHGHTAVRYKTQVLVFGGENLGTPTEDAGSVFSYDSVAKRWSELKVANGAADGVAPSARSRHSAFVVGDSMYVVGGCAKSECTKDVWEFKVSQRTWAKVPYGAKDFAPATRHGKALALPYTADSALLVSGCTREACDGTVAEVDVLELNGVCDGDCQNGGVYEHGRCTCAGNFTGKFCEEKDTIVETHKRPIGECLNNCSANGICIAGKCLCHESFRGADCSELVPLASAGNGTSAKRCPKGCSQNGLCNEETGKCKCDAGFTGVGCSIRDDTQCANNCTDADHGVCEQIEDDRFQCMCKQGWGGNDCSVDARCPEGLTPMLACSGHGMCRAEKCQCDEGFTGLRCHMRGCPKDCSSNGACNATTGACACKAGFADADCSRKLRCPNANQTEMCNGRGECHEDRKGAASGDYDGVCVCKEPFSGASCELQSCPSNEDTDVECSGRGACDKTAGLCACEQGFAGKACELECAEKCNDNGRCFAKTAKRPLCDCKPGFRGVSCQIVVGCPNNCTNHGECVRGSCRCFPGFSGEDCSTEYTCGPSKCSSHGDCRHGKCHCHPGFEGEHCEKTTPCPKGCNGHGECMNGRCYCEASYSGSSCDVLVSCPLDCSNRGLCVRGKCECQMGYSGEACEVAMGSKGCPNNCTFNGECRLGKCFCYPNWEGHSCERYVVPKCPKGNTYLESAVCSDRGLCTSGGKCQCYPGFFGEDCSKAHKCPQDCNLRGLCFNKKCFCNPGFSGEFCERKEPCPGTPNECTDRGLCVNGECICEPGYGGAACEVVTLGKDVCPKKCSGHGLCQVGKCFCEPGFGGKDCSLRAEDACPKNCAGNGECHFGTCYCNPGWSGEACDLVVPCPSGCQAHGTCFHGRCFCNAGWTGDNCTKQMSPGKIPPGNAAKKGNCPNGCSMHGICFRGECLCQAGFQGIDCSRKDETWRDTDRCPNDCRGTNAARASGQFGLCLMGQCYCYPGFTGPSCQEILPLPCPQDCGNRGICQYGKCFCDLGYAGEACEKKVACPLNCNSNGMCHHGQCDCNPGFSGETCEAQTGEQCKNDCNHHGRCYMGKCWCQPGYEGDDCGILNHPNIPVEGEQPRLAGGPNKETRGNIGPITTGAKYGSTAQAMEVRRLEDRNTHGPLLSGAKYSDAKESHEDLVKQARFKANGATIVSGKCELTCSKHGKCKHDDKGQQVCACDVGFVGRSCEKALDCGPNMCGGRGECKYGRCFCQPGFDGPQCEKKVACPNECSKHGECRYGKCFCSTEFEGEACQNKKQCVLGENQQVCSGHGACSKGKCVCDDAHTGDDCGTAKESAKQCINDCSARGLCHNGRCFCQVGFTGISCETVLDGAVDLAANAADSLDAPTQTRFSVFSVVGVAIVAMLAGVLVNLVYSKVSNARKKNSVDTGAQKMALPNMNQSSGFFMLDESTPVPQRN